ncbi:hypothetical protein WA026_010863 [Henosepilachna vigintioctopunctata]
MIVILLFTGVVLMVYLFLVKPYSYWAKKNVPTGKFIPVVEDVLNLILGRESMLDMVQRMYNKVPTGRYTGAYQFRSPIFLIKSPELIKEICVKDFDHFMNRRSILPKNDDDIWSKNLAALTDQPWKNMRSILSPSFTSSKMKSMFFLMCHNANNFVQHFIEKQEKIIEIEMKDSSTRYTIDVIASAAFGIQVDSLKDKDNEFYLMGTSLNNFSSPSRLFALFFYLFLPKVANFLKIPIFEKEIKSFFMNIVTDTLKIRKEKNIKRPDMLGLLMEARNEQQSDVLADTTEGTLDVPPEKLDTKNMKHKLSDIDIASQVFVFFFAGFETVSSAMCFVAYELAANPDVQQKLIDEIDDNRPSNGLPTYETIANMAYLDMVISETLRKWPIAAAMDRVVTKPYTIPPEHPHEKPVHLNVDDIVVVPIYGLHHDPLYYENPEKFDPERFSPENRRKIDPYTYLPFGIGPRSCIGNRFALLEIKALFFFILTHFEIVPIEKTQIPIKIKKSAFNLTSENGFPLGFKKRR